MTEERFQELQAKNQAARAKKPSRPATSKATTSAAAAAAPAPAGVKAWQALGRLPEGQLNKTEQAFAELLDQWKRDGRVQWWKAHPFSIKLAKNTHYRLDFLALMSDGLVTMFEVKGTYTSEKGQAKIKLAAEALPIFRMVKAERQKGGEFKLTEYAP